MPKFFVSNDQINDEKINITGDDVNHIANVLRLQKENQLLICDKDTNITYNTKIKEIMKEKIICEILSINDNKTEGKVIVTIFQGLPKADKMEYIIQKGTELGVNKIIPVAMKRCIVKLDAKEAKKKQERWQKISEVAAKQSGRDLIPKIEELMSISQVKEVVKNYDLFLIAYENEKENTLKKELKNININEFNSINIAVVIGPEGGLEENEVNILKEEGAKIITLGKRILRTETASSAILSNIMYELEM